MLFGCQCLPFDAAVCDSLCASPPCPFSCYSHSVQMPREFPLVCGRIRVPLRPSITSPRNTPPDAHPGLPRPRGRRGGGRHRKGERV